MDELKLTHSDGAIYQDKPIWRVARCPICKCIFTGGVAITDKPPNENLTITTDGNVGSNPNPNQVLHVVDQGTVEEEE